MIENRKVYSLCGFLLSLTLLLHACAPPRVSDDPVEEAKRECRTLPGSSQQLCQAVIEARLQLYRESDFFDDPAVREKVYAAVAETPKLIAERNTDTAAICEVNDNGSIVCIKVQSLLASVDVEMGWAILGDLAKLHAVFDLDPTEDILLGCGNGSWVTPELPEGSQSSDIESLVENQAAERMVSQCAELQQASVGVASGFSGITGLDSYGLPSYCGVGEIPTETGFDRYVAQAMAMVQEAHKYCPSSITPMEGGSAETPEQPKPPPPPPDDPPAPTPPEDPPVVENPDGTKTKTEVVKEDGNTVETKTTTEDGNVVKIEKTTWKKNGTKTRSTRNFDPDGNVASGQDQEWAGDGYHERSIGPGGATDYFQDPSGGTLFSPLGMTMWDSEGNMVFDSMNDCLDSDEVCQTCRDFSAYMPQTLESCMLSGGESYECRKFTSEAECCSNPNAFPGDPRILIPDPSGDFACLGEVDLDFKQGACELRCSVAEHEDCSSVCVSTGSPSLEYSLLDNVCLSAYSEACARSAGGIPVPVDIEHGDGLPLPTDLSDHFLLPSVGGVPDINK